MHLSNSGRQRQREREFKRQTVKYSAVYCNSRHCRLISVHIKWNINFTIHKYFNGTTSSTHESVGCHCFPIVEKWGERKPCRSLSFSLALSRSHFLKRKLVKSNWILQIWYESWCGDSFSKFLHKYLVLYAWEVLKLLLSRAFFSSLSLSLCVCASSSAQMHSTLHKHKYQQRYDVEGFYAWCVAAVACHHIPFISKHYFMS